MKFLDWLNSHKTKLTGVALVVAGALQANSGTVQSLLSPQGYGWFTLITGCVVAALGFLNGRQTPQQ